MFFVSGNFLLFTGLIADDVLNCYKHFFESIVLAKNNYSGTGESLNVVPFNSEKEAKKFVSLYVEIIGFKITKIEKLRNGNRYMIEKTDIANSLYYYIDVCKVKPISVKKWRKVINIASNYIKYNF